MTPHGGVELWLPTASRSGVFRNLPAGIARGQGWTEGQLLLSLCLLNILGYECAEDLDRMEADEGLCGLVRRHERRILGLSRRQLDGRHRKGRTRTFPSPRSMLDWLHDQHDEAAARERCKGSAYVPPPSASLLPLQEASRRLVSLVAEEVDLRQATVDIDATIIASYKKDALPTYRSANGTCPGELGPEEVLSEIATAERSLASGRIASRNTSEPRCPRQEGRKDQNQRKWRQNARPVPRPDKLIADPATR